VPVCPTCGKDYSSFSFGSAPPKECPDCRKARALASVLVSAPAGTPSVLPSTGARKSSRPVVTLALIAVNLIVYVAMGLSGASWTEPSLPQAIRWGADFGVLALAGQWWRLLTSTFVHFGIIHILFNMWCLFDLGLSLEPMMGRKAYALVYFVSGIAASAVSLAWNQWRVSAGASGAIFGVAGALVSYLYLKRTTVDPAIVRQRLKSLGVFIIYNLFRGALNFGIDNSGHMGGLATGLILGALIPATVSGSAFREGPPNQLASASAFPIEDASSRTAEDSRLGWIALGSALVLVLSLAQIARMHVPVAGYGSAVQLIRAGNLERAAAKLEEAVGLDPNLLYAQALLGELRLGQNEPAAAILPFEKALELSPNSNLVRHNLALAYLGAGRPADSMRQIGQVMDKEKENQWSAYFISGLAADELGNSAAARKYLLSAIQAKQDFYPAQDALARLDLIEGHLEEAQSLYTGVLKHDPEDPVANSDSKLLKFGGGRPPRPGDLATFPIPFSKLELKSAAWPYYP
jgi:rhomboid protease GluP